MNKNSKRVLSIIVLTIFAMSFITLPTAFAALGTPLLDGPDPISVGEDLRVYGGASEVTSGAEVEIYWDIVEGVNAHKIGSGYGAANGSYSVTVQAPAAVAGIHYIWVKDTHTGATARSVAFDVEAGITVSPTSGLPGDAVTVEGSGFPAESLISLFFQNSTHWWVGPTVETDDLGSFSQNYPVPSSPLPSYSPNYEYVANMTGHSATASYEVTASISISESEGPSGNVITINGRGFTPATLLDTNDFEIDGVNPYVVGDDVTVTTGGTFSVQVVVPSLSIGDVTVIAYDSAPGVSGSTDYAVTGESSISVNPTYGSPGASITVTGSNYTQIAGQGVEITIDGFVPVHGTGVTLSDGTFEATFTVPAYAFGNYDVVATDDSDLSAMDDFKIGILALILTPTSGSSGLLVSVTGVGFAAGGTYNATLDGNLVIEDGPIASPQETLSDTFYVPTMEAGEYTVTVEDSEGNELSVPYTVTGTTTLTASPSNVALTYPVGLSGMNFADIAGGSLTWYIGNSTWGMEISSEVFIPGSMVTLATTDEDGDIDAEWEVDQDLILGNEYTINVTDGEGLYAEVTITIVEEEVEIDSTSSVYALGDTITYKLKATFAKIGAILEVVDPEGNLYFMSTLNDWTSVGDWQVVQVRNQLDDASGYPFILPQDAMTGIWNWTLTYDHTLLGEQSWTGLITVLPTSTAQIYDSLTSVTDQLTNVTDIVNGQQGAIGDIQSGLSDLASVVSGNSDTLDSLSDQVANAVSQASSAVDAANQAVSAAQSATSAANQAASVAQEAVSAAVSAKVEASSAKTAALAAETAANAAADASSGLSTLVYGAIAASLIAALAAIVSLMQINKKIA